MPFIILNKYIPSKDHALAPVRVTQTIIKNIAEASSATITCRSHQFSVGRRHEADLLFGRNITIKFNCLYFRFPYFRPFPEDRLLLEHNPGTAGYPEAPRLCSFCCILPEGKYSVLVCYLFLSKPQALKMPAAHVHNQLDWVFSPLASFPSTKSNENILCPHQWDTFILHSLWFLSTLRLTAYSEKVCLRSGNCGNLWLHGLKLNEGILTPLCR